MMTTTSGEARTPRRTMFHGAGVATLILTIVSLVFTAGYNWRRIDEIASAQIEAKASMDANYVRKDVNTQQLITITTQLEDIKNQLTLLRQQMRERAR